ncbi:MAG: insulinase family protein [Candidatus Rokubacteria bacterium]|nr:insulinase family protein [Candidatus Rokubacteria bacterium]
MTIALALALIVLAGATTAAADETRVTRSTLPNGLRVLVRENPAAGVVAISLLVRAGARFETPENAGITNFLHRVIARGTTRRSHVELSIAAEELGGSIDASGDVEYAEIRGTALARHWEAMLGLVAEVALQPSLPADAIQTERRLILSQIQTRADQPFQFALDALLGDLYAGHPYALPGVGLRAGVEKISRDDLLAHYRATFQPQRMVLAVGGQVVPARVVAAAGKLFGGMAGGGGSAADPAPSLTPPGKRRVLERPAQQAQVLVGFAGPSVADPDYAAVKVLGAVLGGGMSGRFFVELRDKLGLAYSLGAIYATRAGPALIVGYMGTAPASVEPAEAGMLREIERIRREPPNAEEVARAKAYLQGTLAMDRRTNARQAWYLAFFELIGAGYDFPDRYARQLGTVTAADVQAAARRYLERPTIIVLRPR